MARKQTRVAAWIVLLGTAVGLIVATFLPWIALPGESDELLTGWQLVNAPGPAPGWEGCGSMTCPMENFRDDSGFFINGGWTLFTAAWIVVVAVLAATFGVVGGRRERLPLGARIVAIALVVWLVPSVLFALITMGTADYASDGGPGPTVVVISCVVALCTLPLAVGFKWSRDWIEL